MFRASRRGFFRRFRHEGRHDCHLVGLVACEALHPGSALGTAQPRPDAFWRHGFTGEHSPTDDPDGWLPNSNAAGAATLRFRVETLLALAKQYDELVAEGSEIPDDLLRPVPVVPGDPAARDPTCRERFVERAGSGFALRPVRSRDQQDLRAAGLVMACMQPRTAWRVGRGRGVGWRG